MCARVSNEHSAECTVGNTLNETQWFKGIEQNLIHIMNWSWITQKYGTKRSEDNGLEKNALNEMHWTKLRNKKHFTKCTAQNTLKDMNWIKWTG